MEIVSVQLKIGLEVHVELATASKMFSRCPAPASGQHDDAEANSLIDATVLALPGSLPVMNHRAVEMAMLVGLALNCEIAKKAKWDRKNYFYPDMPKAYQVSQYDMPLCGAGFVDIPAIDAKGEPDFAVGAAGTRIRITRAHLEEDAGKLLHEAPGGGRIDYTIVDLNRAGTPLLEIVTEPDFTSAEQVVYFCKQLRTMCRFLGVTQGIMQEGHMRFEPNINCVLTLADGRTVQTPIVEVKNLNSFKSVKGAIECELAEQPGRWQSDGREMGRGMKITRGWDDVKNKTFVQREKEDAHDYRYFPDPDLVPVIVSDAWREEVRGRLPELPAARMRRYMSELKLASKEAIALAEEREVVLMHDAATAYMSHHGVEAVRAGQLSANLILQNGQKRANERGVLVSSLGITAEQIGSLGVLRDTGKINSNSLDELFGVLCEAGGAQLDAEVLAKERGLIIVQDEGALLKWIDDVVAANPKPAEDVRAGKMQAAGRLIGEVMKLAAGKADAKTVREALLKRLGQ